ncbi:hypothetical protein F4775DRAFT_601441 [Biscogniauxia sp. FL1348]|nr:hypothetical protein F4775DRAFT_601441 [Biscogniauxia sp. FL1348]
MSSDPDWVPPVYISHGQTSYYQEPAVSPSPRYVVNPLHDYSQEYQYSNEQRAAAPFDETPPTDPQAHDPTIPSCTTDTSYETCLSETAYSSPSSFAVPALEPQSLLAPQTQTQTDPDRALAMKTEEDDNNGVRWIFHRDDLNLKVTEARPRPKRGRPRSDVGEEPISVRGAEDPGQMPKRHRKKRQRFREAATEKDDEGEGKGKGKETERGETLVSSRPALIGG